MGQNSAIEWTDHTWNPWQGCTKVSPACQHCYMFRDMPRFGHDPSVVRPSSDATLKLPLAKKRGGEWKMPSGSKVFTCSWSDWFHADADEWRDEAWEIVRKRPDLIFQIVTKRTNRIEQCLPRDWGKGYRNVWLIATAENQEWLDKRAADLLQVPAAIRGLSIEPLLGPMDVVPYLGGSSYRCRCGFHRTESELSFMGGDKYFCMDCRERCQICPTFDWIIVGGESGPYSRPMHPDWVRGIRDQCQETGVPFFFKQWGEFSPLDGDPGRSKTYRIDKTGRDVSGLHGLHSEDDAVMVREGKKLAGRMLDGRTWDEFPEVQNVTTNHG